MSTYQILVGVFKMEILFGCSSPKRPAAYCTNNLNSGVSKSKAAVSFINQNEGMSKNSKPSNLNDLSLAYKCSTRPSVEENLAAERRLTFQTTSSGRRRRRSTSPQKENIEISKLTENGVSSADVLLSLEDCGKISARPAKRSQTGLPGGTSIMKCHDLQATETTECNKSKAQENMENSRTHSCAMCSMLYSTTALKPSPLALRNRTQQGENVDIPTVVKGDVSRYIPNSQINPVDTDDEQTYTLYEESFIHNCRLEHMVMVMALHPQYLQQFLDTNYHLLQSKGALPFQYRSYIAIMAAARHRCTYLVHLMEAHFLLQGGDREWLRGLNHVPAKLRALSTLNKLLAHRPWLVTPNHIKELVDGDATCRWQHPELAQAIVLLCHFHGLAVFCHATGINLEIDHETAHAFHYKSTQPSPNSSPSSGSTSPNYGRLSPIIDNIGFEQTGDVEVLMERMKKLQEEEEEVTREEMNRRFEKEKDEASHGLIPGTNSPVGGAAYFARYVVDPDFSYQEFAKRDVAAEIPTFREQDYNWSDHACLVVRKFNSDVADLLDMKFNTAYNLTYKTLASKDNVDTTSLRRAVWMYVHCMYGIMYDDYNYGEVNQLLERPLKLFIKTASCFPEKTTRKVYDGFWKQFRHSEKVHVTIMIMESRLQVGLLYGMRALTDYLRDS
uniref:Sestrin-3 n=1 Tax=Phallusia mammillata TaxID=59560 RepID=A0A6F9DS42_9ASCI|nr:sestrin-3 [Phallusia mammillata]